MSELFVVLFLMSAAHAAECPADRPIKRDVIDYSASMTCNSNLNLVLQCPKDGASPCTYSNHPTCTPIPVKTQCFSQDEIDKASR